MPIDLIFSDIDGTLLNKDRELSNKTISQIQRLTSIPFILISSRMPKAMRHLQKELKNEYLPLIAYNGGLILDDENIIESTEITIDIMRSLVKNIKNTSLHFSLYHNDEWYVPEFDYWAQREANNTKVTPIIQAIETTLTNWDKEQKGAHKVMIMGDPNEIDIVVKIIEQNYSNEIIGYRSKDTYLEIAPKSISKKTAVETIISSHYPKTSLNNVLVFGDNYNDIEMLKAVGFGIAVQNANDSVLLAADAITDSNKENGVANYLELYIP